MKLLFPEGWPPSEKELKTAPNSSNSQKSAISELSTTSTASKDKLKKEGKPGQVDSKVVLFFGCVGVWRGGVCSGGVVKCAV